jgi:hypothetical protein
VDGFVFFTAFGAAVAAAVLFGAAWGRARRRLNHLEDRLLTGQGIQDLAELEERVNELSLRVGQLARGQEFLQQLLAGRRRLPGSTKRLETTPT